MDWKPGLLAGVTVKFAALVASPLALGTHPALLWITVAAVIAVAALVVRRIVTPLELLTRAALDDTGDPDPRLADRSPPELRDLAASIVRLKERLHAYRVKINEQNAQSPAGRSPAPAPARARGCRSAGPGWRPR